MQGFNMYRYSSLSYKKQRKVLLHFTIILNKMISYLSCDYFCSKYFP